MVEGIGVVALDRSNNSLSLFFGDAVEEEQKETGVAGSPKLVLETDEAVHVTIHVHLEIRSHLAQKSSNCFVKLEFFHLHNAIHAIFDVLI